MSDDIFKFEWVNSASDIDKKTWNECFPDDVEGFWWYRALEQSELDDQFTFDYGVLYHNQKPIGIVPCFTMNLPISMSLPNFLSTILGFIGRFIPSILFQPTFFIGSPCADEGTIGIKNGYNLHELIPIIHTNCLVRASALGKYLLVYKDFPQDVMGEMDPLITQFGMSRALSFPGTRLKLDRCDSFESYLNMLSTKRRYNIKKNIRISNKALELVTVIESNPDLTKLDAIFNLFWGTYLKGTTKFEKLNKRFFMHIANNKEVTFICLYEKQSQKLVAFMLCFQLKNKIINKFIGIDYSQPKEACLYYRLWEASITWAIEMGATEFQSGQTGYPFKLQAGCELVPLYNYLYHKNVIFNWLCKIIAPNIDWGTLDPNLKGYHQKKLI